MDFHQQVKINSFCSRVTVDVAEPQLDPHLVNQTHPQGNQNDPMTQERYKESQLSIHYWVKMSVTAFVCSPQFAPNSMQPNYSRQ